MTEAEIEANRIIEMFREADYQDLSESGLKSISLIHVEGIIEMMLKCDEDDQSYYYMGEQKLWQAVRQIILNK